MLKKLEFKRFWR